MAEAAIAPGEGRSLGLPARALLAVARQRELSLLLIIVALVVFVAVQAPQFLSQGNLTQLSVLASIIAIAAVGQALVVITRNVDLSVESTIGLVALVVAEVLSQRALPVPAAWALGLGLGLALGMVNGAIVAVFRVPAIVVTLGTLSIYRGLAFTLAGGTQVTLTDLPPGYTDPSRWNVVGIPLFVLIAIAITVVVGVAVRQLAFGRQIYAVGSNPEAAETLGIRTGLVVFSVFALSGLLAGAAGILWGLEFGTINATAASGVVLQVIAAVVVGGVNIFGGSGTVFGAALGALLLGLISNALIVLRLSQFWLQAIYGGVILTAVSADALIVRRVQRLVAERRRR